MTDSFRLIWRMLMRDLRAGTLTVLTVAMTLAVTALTGVGLLADRVQRGIESEAHQLLGGDLLLTADHRWSRGFHEAAATRQLQVAESASFPSMVASAQGVQLAEIKAISSNYPLRGHLRVAPRLNADDAPMMGAPPLRSVWPDVRLASGLGVDVPSSLKIGAVEMAASAIVTFEPDRGINPFSLAPRLVMHLDDLPATELIQPGSRITWRLHVAGEAAAVADFRDWAERQLRRGERIEGLDNARPEIRNIVDRAQRFLKLAALLTVILAAVAVGLAAHRFMQLHLDACAVMRCMGASERKILVLHAGEFMVLGLGAIVLGSAAGFALQAVLHAALAGIVAERLPAPGWLPLGQGFVVGAVLLAGFVVPPLLRLKSVPTVRVLRREWGGVAPMTWLSYSIGMLLLAALIFWIANDLKLGAVVLGGFAVAICVFAVIGKALLLSLKWLPARMVSGGWRFGLANLQRRPGQVLIQLISLSLGLTTLLLLTLARDDLIDAWRTRLPADAPNRFVINIQPEQQAAIAAHFLADGLPVPRLEPMVRGRLMRVNARAVSANDYVDDRARRLIDREFNLSERDDLPVGNDVMAGRWYAAGSEMQYSVEKGLAETLNLHMGDELVFEVAGQPLAGKVTSLRKLDWDSMRVNFFVLAPRGSLTGQPASYITSFHLPTGQEASLDRLVRRFPNLTVIDVTSLLRKLHETLDQVVGAVQLLFGISLFAGFAVLYAALQSGAAERHHELAVLRSLGARQGQLRQSLVVEFALLGGLAGVMSGIAAALLGLVLARLVFHLDFWPSPGWALWGVVLGASMAVLLGLRATGVALRQPVVVGLRQT